MNKIIEQPVSCVASFNKKKIILITIDSNTNKHISIDFHSKIKNKSVKLYHVNYLGVIPDLADFL